jgi:uncharacterized protein YdeI (YjbR/CyaY-like superfamily)
MLSTPFLTRSISRTRHVAPARRLSIMTSTSQFPTLAFPSTALFDAFPSTALFDAFLAREHDTAPGIYLKLAKKASGIPSITAAEAVEVALCHGWIDGRANAVDNQWWTVRYTPRRARSIWSQKNVKTVARLIEDGRMRPAGLAAVEAAQADGRWDRAYAGSANMVAPADFTEALATEPTAKAYFEALNKSEQFAILMQLATVSDKNRSKKMSALVQTLAVGKIPGVRKAKPNKTATSNKPSVKRQAQSSGSLSPDYDARQRVKREEISQGLPDVRLPRREGLRQRI